MRDPDWREIPPPPPTDRTLIARAEHRFDRRERGELVQWLSAGGARLLIGCVR